MVLLHCVTLNSNVYYWYILNVVCQQILHKILYKNEIKATKGMFTLVTTDHDHHFLKSIRVNGCTLLYTRSPTIRLGMHEHVIKWMRKWHKEFYMSINGQFLAVTSILRWENPNKLSQLKNEVDHARGDSINMFLFFSHFSYLDWNIASRSKSLYTLSHDQNFKKSWSGLLLVMIFRPLTMIKRILISFFLMTWSCV